MGGPIIIPPQPDDHPMTATSGARSIELAEELPFTVANAQVRPATLEVVVGERRELLEPRVMQVLVALARRRGEMVSRDELIELCWDGRIVGDDAITRCLARLRKLAGSIGGFRIETLPRVGVRLVEASDTDQSSSVHQAGRNWLWPTAGLVILALLAAVAWIAWRSLTVEISPPPRVALAEFRALGGDPATRALSERLSDHVAGMLGDNVVGLTLSEARTGEAEGADMTLGGTVRREGSVWRVRAVLQDEGRKVVLWSRQFDAADEAVLRDEVAVAATEAVYDAVVALEDTHPRPGVRALALYIKASEALRNPGLHEAQAPRRLSEQAIAQAPHFVGARSILALSLAHSTFEAPFQEQTALLQRARREAETAIRRDPAAAGGAYDALYILARREAPNELAQAEDILVEGQRQAPQHPFLHMRRCRFLVEVGRAREALPHCERARALYALAGPVGFRYGEALYGVGDLDRAAAALDRAARFHPNHANTRRIRFEIAAFAGPPESALQLLRDPSRGPPGLRAEGTKAMELFLVARQSGAPTDIDSAVAALQIAARSGGVSNRYLVFGAAKLGRLDEAFAALQAPGVHLAGDPAYLVEPAAAPLWRDRRFWPLAAKAGYLRYWQTRNRWPDFCDDPAYGIDCRKEAARVAHNEN
jgi:DNA-binding winged helix-turn-helix (wHTH) protein/TolB-like protein